LLNTWKFSVFFFATILLAFPAHAAPTLVQRALQVLQGGGSQVVPSPASVEIAFSPGGGATDLVVKAIASAKQSIHVAAYSFTSRPIAKALAEAHKAGIDVDVLVDHSQIEKDNHSVTAFLIVAKIPLRVDIVHALQHDKYMVIDGKTVETGSFNYTAAAEQHNSENVIVLWDDPALAAAYGENWKSLWDQAETYSGQP
jgi:phosphatidylserine/phosphatidylglycerophosphate/cardiolipin synthase-like enzyme